MLYRFTRLAIHSFHIKWDDSMFIGLFIDHLLYRVIGKSFLFPCWLSFLHSDTACSCSTVQERVSRTWKIDRKRNIQIIKHFSEENVLLAVERADCASEVLDEWRQKPQEKKEIMPHMDHSFYRCDHNLQANQINIEWKMRAYFSSRL